MVVDGNEEFVGSNFEKAKKAVESAVKSEKAELNVSLIGEKLNISVTAIPKHGDATVYLAFVEDNVGSNVKRGENAGKNLTHISVVRALRGLGRIGANDSSFKMELPFQIDTDWNSDNINAIVFVQENMSRRVLGVTRSGLYKEKLPK
jgi:hypothetical protein